MLIVPMHSPALPAPTDLLLKLRPVLSAVVALQFVTALMRMLSSDIFGAISDGIVACMGGFAVSARAMQYVLTYGLACGVNAIVDLVLLFLRISILKAGYFDLARGLMFNVYSFAILAACVADLMGAAVSFAIFRDARRRENNEGGFPFLQPDSVGDVGYGSNGDVFFDPFLTAASGRDFKAFQGRGQRLGSEDLRVLRHEISIDNLPEPPTPPQIGIRTSDAPNS